MKYLKKYPVRGYRTIFAAILVVLLIVASSVVFGGCTPKIEVKLYFANYEDNQAFLSPETRQIIKSADLYKNVLEELVKGPESENLYPTLPSDVVVYSVIVDNGLAIADFSHEIITNTTEIPHSSTTEILAIFSIVDTLTEFEEIQKVRITVEGKQTGQIEGLYIEDFWGHLGIYEDFERNEQVLSKEGIPEQ